MTMTQEWDGIAGSDAVPQPVNAGAAGNAGGKAKTGTIVARDGKRRPSTRYFQEGFYSLHGDRELLRMAGERLPTAMRLWFLCSARANIWGHAAFEPSEMGRLLRVDRKTRTKALDSLRTGRCIAPESTPLCVVLNGAVYRRADRARSECREPAHSERRMLLWTPGGWESEPGGWHAALNVVRRVTEEVEEVEETRTTRRRRRTVEEVRTTAECWHAPCAEVRRLNPQFTGCHVTRLGDDGVRYCLGCGSPDCGMARPGGPGCPRPPQ